MEIGQQLDVGFRLVIAALLGGAIGFEREIHGHPAGMRTHMLVSLGSAAFTVLGVFFFSSPGVSTDPSRIAAQIVSGIGFLGAGAILKYGTSVRGLTTAASLWATAAVGMAAGAGAWLVAIVTTVLIVLSLGPLNWLIARLRSGQPHIFRLRVQVVRLEAVGEISRALTQNKIEIVSVSTQRLGKGRYEIDLDLRPPPAMKDESIISMISTVPETEILEGGRPIE
ncbi:MAG: putative Mg2+ transporter-C (MgtC) family protein [Chloroflexota bacterium]|nr:putative Mg2+ transporter-C (MgtC) family protein [Chloroflexota bacterium]